MLKHEELIKKMTVSQKINLITDGFQPKGSGDDLPSVKISDLRENGKDLPRFPDDYTLANSFDDKLVGRVTAALALREKEAGSSVVRISGAKPKICPYSAGDTEDDVLAEKFLERKVDAMSEVGVAACVSDYSVSGTEADHLDLMPSGRQLKDYLFRPLSSAMQKNGTFIAETDRYKKLFDEYENINSTVVKDLLESSGGQFTVAVRKTPSAFARDCFDSGATFVSEGAKGYLEGAVKRYERIKRDAIEGVGSFDDVDRAVKTGVAVSEELLNEWADRALDVAIRANEKTVDKTLIGDEDELNYNATLSSFVLLKNNNVLPLKKTDNVALIGAIAAHKEDGYDKFLENSADDLGFIYRGFEKGYELSGDKDIELISKAVELARGADKVILFLGLTAEREENMERKRVTALPSEQLCLLDALIALKKPLIAVISGSYPIDVCFDVSVKGLIVSPLRCEYRSKALTELLTGRQNFSGRLANTYSDNADEYWSEIRNNKSLKRNKVGPFLGYKYYSSAKLPVKYPLGYGLSYTSFAYSGITASQNEVSFTVKNTGRADGACVPQVYVGMPSSSIIRPLKELKGFSKVFLKAGESKKITIPLGENAFKVYDAHSKNYFVEKGAYRIYVGENVRDATLSQTVQVAGVKIKKTEAKKEDYLQTVSNIVSGDYKLRQRQDYSKRKTLIGLNIGLTISLLSLAVTTVLLYANEKTTTFVIISAILSIGLAAIKSAVKRSSENKLKSEKEKMGKIINKQLPLEKLAGKPLSDLFTEEFAEPQFEVKEENFAKTEEKETEDLSGFFVKDLTLEKICSDFIAFTSERGFVVDKKTALSVFSSMLSTRLIVLCNDDAETRARFINLLSEFFGATAYTQSVAGAEEFGDLFFDAYGRERPIALAAKNSVRQKHSVQFTVFDDVDFSCVEKFFSVFMRYVVNPTADFSFTVRSEAVTDKTFTLADNEWFIITSDASSYFKAPDFILDAAAIVSVKLAVEYGEKEHMDISPVSLHQFLALCDQAVENVEIGEGMWKRIDKLEKFVADRADYAIGNKMWQRVERFAASYCAMGGESEQAEDELVASKLLVGMIAKLKKAGDFDEQALMTALEGIFGEENVGACRAAIKYYKYFKIQNN